MLLQHLLCMMTSCLFLDCTKEPANHISLQAGARAPRVSYVTGQTCLLCVIPLSSTATDSYFSMLLHLFSTHFTH